ncbi:unnamed protein product [Boreogadus saida]
MEALGESKQQKTTSRLRGLTATSALRVTRSHGNPTPTYCTGTRWYSVMLMVVVLGYQVMVDVCSRVTVAGLSPVHFMQCSHDNEDFEGVHCHVFEAAPP